jgi:hypothetical protein
MYVQWSPIYTTRRRVTSNWFRSLIVVVAYVPIQYSSIPRPSLRLTYPTFLTQAKVAIKLCYIRETSARKRRIKSAICTGNKDRRSDIPNRDERGYWTFLWSTTLRLEILRQDLTCNFWQHIRSILPGRHIPLGAGPLDRTNVYLIRSALIG